MAPLPQFRLGMTYRPFTNCATDFGRPYLTSQGRGRIRTKKNSCLFLCLQTLCCHLEMATSLDAAGFLNAFTRMTARRGWLKMLLSDNGTNFIVGDRDQRVGSTIRPRSDSALISKQRNRLALESTSSTSFRRSLRGHKGCRTSDLGYFKRRRYSGRGTSNLLRWSGKFIEFQTTHDCQR